MTHKITSKLCRMLVETLPKMVRPTTNINTQEDIRIEAEQQQQLGNLSPITPHTHTQTHAHTQTHPITSTPPQTSTSTLSSTEKQYQYQQYNNDNQSLLQQHHNQYQQTQEKPIMPNPNHYTDQHHIHQPPTHSQQQQYHQHQHHHQKKQLNPAYNDHHQPPPHQHQHQHQRLQQHQHQHQQYTNKHPQPRPNPTPPFKSLFTRLNKSIDVLADMDTIISRKTQTLAKTLITSSSNRRKPHPSVTNTHNPTHATTAPKPKNVLSVLLRRTALEMSEGVTGLRDGIKDGVATGLGGMFRGAPTSSTGSRDEWEDDRRTTASQRRRR